MRLLGIAHGDYGDRHLANIRRSMPADWVLHEWRPPRFLPPVIDYPEEYLPTSLPAADLILAVAEHRGVAELLPDVAGMCGASAVIAAIDNEAWLPRGLARQLRGWLQEMGVACVTPKPLCSLTESDYLQGRRRRVAYQNELIAEFARHWGQPAFDITVDPQTHCITQVVVRRDAVCGCAHFVASQLVGVSADDAEGEAGLHHHHYPCWASMGIDSDFNDTLMHASGNLLKDAVAEQVKPFKQIRQITPGHRSD
ncbi:MAG: hypothetical protein GXP37_07010 [Chloroflexi bacterium]|nr:hypothetical protein [Chloroflexota bacterium]